MSFMKYSKAAAQRAPLLCIRRTFTPAAEKYPNTTSLPKAIFRQSTWASFSSSSSSKPPSSGSQAGRPSNTNTAGERTRVNEDAKVTSTSRGAPPFKSDISSPSAGKFQSLKDENIVVINEKKKMTAEVDASKKLEGNSPFVAPDNLRSASSSPSSTSAPSATTSSSEVSPTGHAQPFVQARIRPGEWDRDRTDPLYRPKYRARAQILSAEDFAKRPNVGFDGEFASLQDAMITLSWLTQSHQKEIYQLYVDLMQHGHNKHNGRTSHEYVVRILAQKYNMTADRVAAVIQLQHNEEQILLNEPDRELAADVADYMDQAIQETIREAYETFGMRSHEEEFFVEDPVGSDGQQDSKKWKVVEDLFDVDKMFQETLVREDEEARLIIDGHVYIEDVDDATVQAPISTGCRHLMRAHDKFMVEGSTKTPTSAPASLQASEDGKKGDEASNSPTPMDDLKKPTAQQQQRAQSGRPQWKYVAQVVNTRELKKAKKGTSYSNNRPIDTLVEEGGRLRPATMADVKQTSWKPVRHIQEFLYAGAKGGWIDRQVHGKNKAWGKAPPSAQSSRPARPPIAKEATSEE